MLKLSKLIARLREPSSLAGLAGIAILAGRSVPEVQAATDAVGAALGVLSVLIPEGKKE